MATSMADFWKPKTILRQSAYFQPRPVHPLVRTGKGLCELNRQIVEPMTRSELTNRLAGHFAHLPAEQIEAAVRSLLDRLSLSLQSGERTEIRGFGGFSLHHHEPRVGRNPKTGEAVELPARSVIHFKPGQELRERVNAS